MIKRVIFSIVLGTMIGALPSLPLVVITSFTEDQPSFWIWPFYSTIFAIIVFFAIGREQ
jgi:hypothetical protein